MRALNVSNTENSMKIVYFFVNLDLVFMNGPFVPVLRRKSMIFFSENVLDCMQTGDLRN